MIPLNRLKKDVQFNTDLTHVVDVLKGIAAARYFVLQRQLVLFEKYMEAAGEILSLIDFREVSHPFAAPRSDRAGVLLVTSDAGFLGGLNARVVHAGLQQAGIDGSITVVGERGVIYLRGVQRRFSTFPGIEDASRLALACSIRDHLVKQLLSGACGKLVVVYPKPVSFSHQEITAEVLMPCTAWIQPKEDPVNRAAIIWESSQNDLVDYVGREWISHRLEQIFALSRLAEFAARAIHLEGSYQELLRRGKTLKHQYFRSRHEVIDRSMREIYAAQLFSKKGEES
ncbi:MAG: F0F1 ATP synthase subunit gamma [Candidatus Omnitrophica bacterium]|nr:F0F1 ATP synthase subunit gamma [Candidatus Omnitrophota bacterium]